MSPQTGYSPEDLSRLTGLETRTALRMARDLDLVPLPSEGLGTDAEPEFDFETVVLLREAKKLRDAKVPGRRVSAAIRSVRSQMPEGRTTGLSFSVLNRLVVARSGDTCWHPETGQTVLFFDSEEGAGAADVSPDGNTSRQEPVVVDAGTPEGSYLKNTVVPFRLPRREVEDDPVSSPSERAEDWLERARALEENDERAAESAYQKALIETQTSSDGALTDLRFQALLDSGRLFHRTGRVPEAAANYAAAESIARSLDDRSLEALASFNSGVAHEDLGDEPAALASYERAVERDPGLADAWYNLSRLYDGRGRKSSAFRCLKEYRELLERDGEES